MSDILHLTEKFTTDLLSSELDANYLYHNLTHTKRVVKTAQELVEFYQLADADSEALLLTAWMHDIGYTKGSAHHEEASCQLAHSFLLEHGYSEEGVKKVEALIRATKMGHVPTNQLEEIIRDADCSHLGQKSYLETAEYLRQELSLLGIADHTPQEWREKNLDFLQKHHNYYTSYAQENWEPVKQKNIKKLLKEDNLEREIAKKEKLKAKFKTESPDRGIQTLFRVTLKNHLTLSDIADTKANILLSVNAIIISVALSNLIPKLDNPSNTYLIYPTVIFITFSVISMILAVLATRPNVTSGKFTKKDVADKKVNLLFFGNFHQMKLHEYEWALKELIKDKEYIYSSLTKDLYFLGLVLNRKYKILRLTYTIFIIGIVISVIAFAISFRLYGSTRIEELGMLLS